MVVFVVVVRWGCLFCIGWVVCLMGLLVILFYGKCVWCGGRDFLFWVLGDKSVCMCVLKFIDSVVIF